MIVFLLTILYYNWKLMPSTWDFYTEIDIIAGKSYAKPFGATTTTTL